MEFFRDILSVFLYLPSLMRSLTIAALAFGLPLAAPARITQRWSFNQASGSTPSGTVLTDSLSSTPATILGSGATFTGSALTLPGTTNGNQTPANLSAYLDLPNGLISSRTHFSLECWFTPLSNKGWQRLFDFGRTSLTGDTARQGSGAAPGEILPTATTAPGGTTSSDQIGLVLNRGTSANTQRLLSRLNGGSEIFSDSDATLNAGTACHVVVTFTSGIGAHAANGGRLQWFLNGSLVTFTDLPFRLSAIEDVNNWIGRSQFANDSNSHFRLDELRLYDHALQPDEVAASYQAGANPAAPVAQDDTYLLHPSSKATLTVLANDQGRADRTSVEILQLPAHGSAAVTPLGHIFYRNTQSAVSDQFTYRVLGPGGWSSPATVTLDFTSQLRLPARTLNLPAEPPDLQFQLQTAATGLNAPTTIASPPGSTTRLFVTEKNGLIRVCDDFSQTNPVFTTFLDLPTLLSGRGETISTVSEQGLLGLAFHPSYASNRYFFISYSVTLSGQRYHRISRFTTRDDNPLLANTTSELVLIEQLDQATNHNGGDLHFGPDGYLYISFGDEGDQNDGLNNSQTLTKDFFSAILRIDVDRRLGSLEPNNHTAVKRDSGVARYAIPPDNPFVGATHFNGSPIANPANIRTEFWAVGLRNPWRMSFDGEDLWIGDVGQGTYEEILLGQAGANYGWAYREGAHDGPKSSSAPSLFDTLYHTPPLYEYLHNGAPGSNPLFTGNSVTGGIVYRGGRFPNLYGKYLFADYVSGHIWSLTPTEQGPPLVERIAGEGGIVAFGHDPVNGDALLADLDGRLLRLVVQTTPSSFPARLSETGLFADLSDLTPNPGIVPYEPILSFWSDHAVKSRWFTFRNPSSRMTPHTDQPWEFPEDQIWVKHFELETTRGNPATRRRIETRLLVRQPSGLYGVTYLWNEQGTDAELAPDGGATIPIPVTVDGQTATQSWIVPGRAQCLICHTPQAGHALSFTTRQLNREFTIFGLTANQLDFLDDAGYLTTSAGSPNLLPRHVAPDDGSASLNARVRSYLDVNCSYCHQAGGTASPAAWDGRGHLNLEQTGLILGALTQQGSDPANRLVVPGDPAHSVLLQRAIAGNGFTRMPPLASNVIDPAAAGLLTAWIEEELPQRQTYDEWRTFYFAASPLGDPSEDPDGDGHSNRAEFLAGTHPLLGSSLPSVSIDRVDDRWTLRTSLPAFRSFVVETSENLSAWHPWDIPGNHGASRPPGATEFLAPAELSPSRRFFRFHLREE